MSRPTDPRSPYTLRRPLTEETATWPTPRAIRIVRPGQREPVVPLRPERHYQIGRAETVELYFEDESVSRFHGFLYYDATFGAWAYRDAGSTFGPSAARWRIPRGASGASRFPLRERRRCCPASTG